MSDKLNKKSSFKTIYPDLTFEKYDIQRWWEYQVKDQQKLYENKYLLIKE